MFTLQWQYTGCKHLRFVQYTMLCGMLHQRVGVSVARSLQFALCSSVQYVVCSIYAIVGSGSGVCNMHHVACIVQSVLGLVLIY